MLRRVAVLFAFAYLVFNVTLAVRSTAQPPASAPPAGPPRQGQAPPAAATPAPAAVDSFAHERDSLMNVVLANIVGRENVAAESVFKDVRVMKKMPAGRLVRIMNMGYGRSLGVGCKHCHVVGEWEKEDKPQKQITRDMMAMSGTINDDLLAKIKGLKSEKPTINCTTCHRGSVKPATNL